MDWRTKMTYISYSNNVETGEIIEREMTAEEIAEREADIARWKAKKAEEKAAQEEKENARKAIFARLGLTEEEVKLILG